MLQRIEAAKAEAQRTPESSERPPPTTEELLIDAVQNIRLHKPESTAKQLHAAIIEQEAWAGTSFGDVKKAASKAAKKATQQQAPHFLAPSMSVGQHVRLHGLKERQELNGFHAIVSSHTEGELQGSMTVRTVHVDETLSVSLANVEPVDSEVGEVLYSTKNIINACVPVGDFGMRAQRAFVKGELVLREKPLAVSYDVNSCAGDDTMDGLMQELTSCLDTEEKDGVPDPRKRAVMEQILDRMTELDFAKLPDSQQKRWMALHDALSEPPSKTPGNIWRSNAYAKDSGEGGCLYELLSRANHSCSPNIGKSFQDDNVEIIALKTISKGEELFMCYLQEEMDKPTEKRRELLHAKYNFLCTCERCGSAP